MEYGIQKGKLHMEGLDALRGIAILGVIFYHLIPAKVPGGFLGVNMFLVLSGYLIYRTSVWDWRADRYSVVSFYRKRIRRIYPALLVMVAAVTGFLVLYIPQVAKGKLAEIVSIVGGYNNIWQVHQSASYFARISQQSPFTHLWATALEMQFYLIWPLLFLMMRLGYRKISKTVVRNILLGVVVVGGVWMSILYRPDQDVSRLYYGTDTRIFALLLGVYVGTIHRDVERACKHRLSVSVHRILLAVSCLLYVAAYFVLEGQMPVLYYGGLFVHSILCGVILLLLPHSGLEHLLEKSPFTLIGKMSYELYLWMYPIIFLFGYNKKNYGAVSRGVQIALIALIAGVQYAVTRYTRRHKARNKGRVVSRFVYVTCSLGIAFMVLVGSVVICEQLPGVTHPSAKVIAKETADNSKSPAPAKDMSNHVAQDMATEESVTTEAGKTESTAPKTITAIGDSVLLGADEDVEAAIPNCVVDAKESRQVAKTRTVVEDLKENGELGDIVILALGTNGTFSPTVGKQLVKAIGKTRQIYWVTVYGQHLQWQEDSNQMIWSMAEKYDNIHVIDWASYCAGHNEWFLKDGVHLTSEGCKAYAKMLYDAVSAEITGEVQ